MSSSAIRLDNCLALLGTDHYLYLSGPGSLWAMNLNNGNIAAKEWRTDPGWLKSFSRFRWLRRLGRLDLREIIQTEHGRLLGSIQKRIFLFDTESNWCRTVFEASGGGRPKGFVLTPSGNLFVGEYWGNPRRLPLRLWGSDDNGQTWELVHTLPKGYAKHIHNLIWDDFRHGIWVLTGDYDGECGLLFTSDEFRTVSEVVRGGQMFRACHLFCRPEGVYYATDTEKAPNWFMFLEPESGKVEMLQPLPGSCIYAGKMASNYFLSTSVERSKVNHHKYAGLWWSSDLQQWFNLTEFKKDWLPGEYFGFGSIIIPRIQGNCPAVAFSTVAVDNFDFSTFILKAVSPDQPAQKPYA